MPSHSISDELSRHEEVAVRFRECRDRIVRVIEDIERDFALPSSNAGSESPNAGSESPNADSSDTNGSSSDANGSSSALENVPAVFAAEPWKRRDSAGNDGGGGLSSFMSGRVFEKAGVHFSKIYGEIPKALVSEIPGQADGSNFFATGVSVVLHPRNPHCPTVHLNVRFLSSAEDWFGGGADMTPVLDARRDREHPDSRAFLDSMYDACAKSGFRDDYQHFRQRCDEYFTLPHRDNQMRGIGGIFYDRLKVSDRKSFEQGLHLCECVVSSFCAVVTKIASANSQLDFEPNDVQQQQFWRGRYVEFNLLYDRGTKFGLMTGGNVKAILSSLPPHASWL